MGRAGGALPHALLAGNEWRDRERGREQVRFVFTFRPIVLSSFERGHSLLAGCRSGCCVVLCRAGAAGVPSITPSFF